MIGGVAAKLSKAIRRHRLGRMALLMVDTLDQHNAVIAASAMAFDAFLSVVPLAAFAGLILHRLHENGDLVLGPLFRASPEPVAELVSAAIGRLTDASSAVVAPLSVAAFLWTTSAGISTAMAVFEQMFHSPPRPWWHRRVIAMMCVLAGVAIIAAVTAITVGIGMISGALGALVALVVPGATLVGLLVAFFRIAIRHGPFAPGSVPRPTATPMPVSIPGRRRLAPGVAVTVVLWTLVSGLFSFYVSTLSRYATLYGGLAAVAIFLFWLWLLSLALLVGGEVNAQLDGLRDPPPPPDGR